MGKYNDLYYDPPTPRKQVSLEHEIAALRAENEDCGRRYEKYTTNPSQAHGRLVSKSPAPPFKGVTNDRRRLE